MSKLAKYILAWTEKRVYLPGAFCAWLPAARRKSEKDAFTSQGRRRAQKAPIYKPSYMTDKQFKDALDGMDKDGKKRLSNALKKLAHRTDKNGQGLMPFAKKKQ